MRPVRMHLAGAARSPSAFVLADTEMFPVDLQSAATTLDGFVAARVTSSDRALLKPYVEGHELAALQGATDLLDRVEVVVSEVRFFDVNASGRPLFLGMVAFLDARRFALFDFASIGGRLRIGDAVFVRRGSRLAETSGRLGCGITCA